jgi:2-polyprenyl-3-methyl-5-hydroxy-6-metoxy-1,4-benzoquinol methylase
MLNESQVNSILPNWDRLQWYYSIELYPGVYTKGFEFNNIALTKKMLDNIDLHGTTALDVSTMEGAMSTIMTKRGASVLATDVFDVSAKVKLVQRAHGVQFDYFPHMPPHRFAEQIFEIQTSRAFHPVHEIGPTDKTNFGFDVVLSSGLMYHVLNPVDHLMTYRKLCKLGGLVVIESAVAMSDEVSFFHVIRPEETLLGGGATWLVTTAAMDLFLRACFLQPLAFCYLAPQKDKDIVQTRLGVVARAVSTRPFDPERYQDLSKSEVFFNPDFRGLQLAALLTGRASKPLSLAMNGLYSAENGVSVSAFNSTEPLTYTQSDLRLSLQNLPTSPGAPEGLITRL